MSDNQMVIHCGGVTKTFEELQEIHLPEQTNTYQVVAHHELAEFIRNTSKELLRRECVRETYATAREGKRMFGLQTFANGDNETGLSVAFRNSYDKSISIGIALGFRVFICDNLAIAGEIKILRKHTKKCWDDIDMILTNTLFRKGPALEAQFKADTAAMKKSIMQLMAGYEFLGRCYGLGIVSPTQMSVAARAWKEEVKRETPADAWMLYNSITGALKSTPPQFIMERHRALHQELLDYAVVDVEQVH